jgi:hypothetical protein
MTSGQTTIVPERSGAGAHLCEHRHPKERYLTFQVRVQVGDGPYVGPALDLGVATMLTVITTLRYPLVRTLTLPVLYTVNLHSFEELRPVPFVHVRVTIRLALVDFFAQLTRVLVPHRPGRYDAFLAFTFRLMAMTGVTAGEAAETLVRDAVFVVVTVKV